VEKLKHSHIPIFAHKRKKWEQREKKKGEEWKGRKGKGSCAP